MGYGLVSGAWEGGGSNPLAGNQFFKALLRKLKKPETFFGEKCGFRFFGEKFGSPPPKIVKIRTIHVFVCPLDSFLALVQHITVAAGIEKKKFRIFVFQEPTKIRHRRSRPAGSSPDTGSPENGRRVGSDENQPVSNFSESESDPNIFQNFFINPSSPR